MLAAAVLVLAGSPARAQSEQEIQTWTLRGVRAGMCIGFLMDSSQAARQISRGYHPRPARAVTGLNPAVQRASQEGEYASWTPAELCFYSADSLQMGDKVIAHDKIHGFEDRQFLAAWLLAAAPDEGQGSPGTYYSPGIMSTNWAVNQRAQTVLLRADHLDAEGGKSPDSSEDSRYEIRIGKTTLIWDGHLADSAQAAEPRRQTWVTPGFRGARSSAEMALQPDSSQAVAGLLRIQGKGDLADALRASPIRMVGPMVWGGTLELRFIRR